MSGFEKLQDEVIRTGLCLDCGTCVGVCPNKTIVMDFEEEEPRLVKQCPTRCDICYPVCPGKDIPIPDMEKMIFGRERTPEEDWIGIVQSCVLANATDPLVRLGGASGGLVSALLIYALENKVIDAALVAGNREDKPWRVIPRIVTNRREVMETSQSKLSVVPNISPLNEALERGYKKLAVVGMPPHVHGVRKIQLAGRPKKAVEAIKFVIGLFHGTDNHYPAAEHIVEELARTPLSEVSTVRIRHGHYPGLYTVFTKDGQRIVLQSDAGRRAHSFCFRTNRDTVAIDYSSELADISAGDYFAPHMVEGVPGLTLAGIRTDIGMKLMQDAEAAGYIETQPGIKDPFGWGGFETKKHGGLYHLMERKRHGWPVPDYHMRIDYPMPKPRNLGIKAKEIHPHY
jgi:coenzyme F420 hydrogenase subunit beta